MTSLHDFFSSWLIVVVLVLVVAVVVAVAVAVVVVVVVVVDALAVFFQWLADSCC